MHAVLHGVSRDQLTAQYKANHIQVAYATSNKTADQGLAAQAVMSKSGDALEQTER